MYWLSKFIKSIQFTTDFNMMEYICPSHLWYEYYTIHNITYEIEIEMPCASISHVTKSVNNSPERIVYFYNNDEFKTYVIWKNANVFWKCIVIIKSNPDLIKNIVFVYFQTQKGVQIKQWRNNNKIWRKLIIPKREFNSIHSVIGFMNELNLK